MFQVIATLGEGAYGKVYKAKDNKTGDIYALKKIRFQSEDEGIPCTAIREIAILKSLQHENIIRLHDVLHGLQKLTLVFEFVDYDLKKVMDMNEENLDSVTVKSLLYQLLSGTAYLHKKKILHRDLKPQNLLITKNNTLKIADFGLARDYMIPVKNYTNEVVTLWYRAPDVLLGSKTYFTTVDVWSCGCIFAEMVTGKPLFAGLNENDQLKHIFKIMGTPNEDDWPELKQLSDWKDDKFETYSTVPLETAVPGLDDVGYDLLQKMLELNPEKRTTAADALNHEYFSDLDESIKSMSKI